MMRGQSHRSMADGLSLGGRDHAFLDLLVEVVLERGFGLRAEVVALLLRAEALLRAPARTRCRRRGGNSPTPRAAETARGCPRTRAKRTLPSARRMPRRLAHRCRLQHTNVSRPLLMSMERFVFFMLQIAFGHGAFCFRYGAYARSTAAFCKSAAAPLLHHSKSNGVQPSDTTLHSQATPRGALSEARQGSVSWQTRLPCARLRNDVSLRGSRRRSCPS